MTRMVEEARLEPSEYGVVAATDGWFVVNVRDAATGKINCPIPFALHHAGVIGVHRADRLQGPLGCHRCSQLCARCV